MGVGLANKAGYAPQGLSDVLKRLQERNRNQDQPNGLFASHPLIKDRLENIASTITQNKLTASAHVAARFSKAIAFTAKPLSEIPVIDGTRGLTGGESKSSKDPKEKDSKESKEKDPKEAEAKPPPKQKGGLLGKIGLTSGSQSQNSQTVASAGARGLGQPDRDAKGGTNPNRVVIIINPADLAEFKKGIV